MHIVKIQCGTEYIHGCVLVKLEKMEDYNKSKADKEPSNRKVIMCCIKKENTELKEAYYWN